MNAAIEGLADRIRKARGLAKELADSLPKFEYGSTKITVDPETLNCVCRSDLANVVIEAQFMPLVVSDLMDVWGYHPTGMESAPEAPAVEPPKEVA